MSSVTNASFSGQASAYDPVFQADLPQLEASKSNFMQGLEKHT